jgi:non-specific serine/threonine protein kinase
VYALFAAYGTAAFGRAAEAEQALDGLLRKHPGDPWTQVGLVFRQALRADEDGAKAAITPDLEARARWDETFSLLAGEALALAGATDSALEWLENAVRRGFVNYPYLSEHGRFLLRLRGERRLEELLVRVKAEWESGFEIEG